MCKKTPLQQHLTSLLGEDQESRNSWYEHRETLKESKGNEVAFENYILPVETGISLWEACWVGLAAYTVRPHAEWDLLPEQQSSLFIRAIFPQPVK